MSELINRFSLLGLVVIGVILFVAVSLSLRRYDAKREREGGIPDDEIPPQDARRRAQGDR